MPSSYSMQHRKTGYTSAQRCSLRLQQQHGEPSHLSVASSDWELCAAAAPHKTLCSVLCCYAKHITCPLRDMYAKQMHQLPLNSFPLFTVCEHSSPARPNQCCIARMGVHYLQRNRNKKYKRKLRDAQSFSLSNRVFTQPGFRPLVRHLHLIIKIILVFC